MVFEICVTEMMGLFVVLEICAFHVKSSLNCNESELGNTS